MKRKLRSRVIDGEGIKTEEKKLIENGVLRFFFNCLSTARQIKDDPSGHGTRTIASIPSASHTNLYLENGKHKKKDMIMSLKKGYKTRPAKASKQDPFLSSLSRQNPYQGLLIPQSVK